MANYNKRYEIYAHKKHTKRINGLYPLVSEYVYNTCRIFAKEQFKRKYPDYVIDIIKLSKY